MEAELGLPEMEVPKLTSPPILVSTVPVTAPEATVSTPPKAAGAKVSPSELKAPADVKENEPEGKAVEV